MIEVKSLVKRYGSHLAVDHLNFTVEKGQIYGFLGPNGAGKSTTMNIMTGYIGATEGEVLIDGHNILTEPEAAKKSIGYLPEIPPLYVDMTVLEYLNFAAELKKIKASQRAKSVADAVEMTKLEEVQHRLIRNLSKGYKQRVGLAQAILGLPEIIILDEPTVGLDPIQIIEIRDLIKTLAKEHTVILSSHILSEVSAVCDYILIISQGKLVASDTPENLLKRMQSSKRLELLVKGEPGQVLEVLDIIEEITEKEVKTGEEEYTTSVVIQVADKENDSQRDIRETLFYLFAENQMPILMMQSTKASLEDIFMELTASESEEVTDVKKGAGSKILKKDLSDAETGDQTVENMAQKEGENAGNL